MNEKGKAIGCTEPPKQESSADRISGMLDMLHHRASNISEEAAAKLERFTLPQPESNCGTLGVAMTPMPEYFANLQHKIDAISRHLDSIRASIDNADL